MEDLDFEFVFKIFQWISIGLTVLWVIWFIRKQRPNSQFGFREADRPHSYFERWKKSTRNTAPSSQSSPHPLLLEGISIKSEPHEILGIPKGSSPERIRRAYRTRMKQYHPDKVARPGTAQWHEAQEIAEAINHAKDTLLKTFWK